jgi:TPP-dependent pyruvate/acetoin dehydrogenase alpha subunit
MREEAQLTGTDLAVLEAEVTAEIDAAIAAAHAAAYEPVEDLVRFVYGEEGS